MAHKSEKHQVTTTPAKPSPRAIERRIQNRSNKVTPNRGVAGASRQNPQVGNKMNRGNAEKIIGALKKDSNNSNGMQRINKFKGFGKK